MKRIVKWLIPCLVACFMVVGLVQTASYTFATTGEDSTLENTTQVADDQNNGENASSEEALKVTTGDGGTSESEEVLEDENYAISPLDVSEDYHTITIRKGQNVDVIGNNIGNYSKYALDITEKDNGYLNIRVRNLANPGSYNITIDGQQYTVNVVSNSVTNMGKNLYVYTMIPGVPRENIDDGNVDSIWNGMGVGTYGQTGPNGPGNIYFSGNKDINAQIKAGTITLPTSTSFPDITVNGTPYSYSKEPGSAQEKTYWIEWVRLVSARGANQGANKYNPVVEQGINTYHLDGIIHLSDEITVRFMLKDVGSENFTECDYEKYRWTTNKDHMTFTTDSIPDRAEPSTYLPTKIDSTTGVQYRLDGWYTDEGCTEKADFTRANYTVEESTTFYARYVPMNVAEPDQNYITVTKTFEGITEEQIPENFSINVGSKTLDESYDKFSSDGLTWTWKVVVPGGGSYNISESNADVENYNRTVTVNGEKQSNDNFGSVTVKKPEIKFSIVSKENSCTDLTYNIGISDETNTVFFGAAKKQLVVISTNSFSEGQKKAIQTWLGTLKLSNDWHVDNVVFYSHEAQGNSFVLESGTVTFSGTQVKFADKSMWTKVMTASYDVTEALNPDVEIVNTYSLNTIDVKVKKLVTGLGADKTKDFDFEYSYGDVSGKFTLTNGQTETIESVPVGTTLTIQETGADGYTVSATYDSSNAKDPKPIQVGQNSKTFTITVDKGKDLVVVTNTKDAAPITGIIDNTPKGLGLIGSIVVEIAAIAFVLKKKRQLKM